MYGRKDFLEFNGMFGSCFLKIVLKNSFWKLRKHNFVVFIKFFFLFWKYVFYVFYNREPNMCFLFSLFSFFLRTENNFQKTWTKQLLTFFSCKNILPPWLCYETKCCTFLPKGFNIDFQLLATIDTMNSSFCVCIYLWTIN